MSIRFIALFTVAAAAAAQTTAPVERVLIRTSKPYAAAVAAIETRGGKVTRQYKYVDAVAAEVPQSQLAAVRSVLGSVVMSKDLPVHRPGNVNVSARQPYGSAGPAAVSADRIQTLTTIEIGKIAKVNPAAYLFNNSLMGLQTLHASGKFGQGVVVAIIDSGLRPGFPHIEGSVIGGEDFVNDGLGYSNPANDGHGTFVSGMVAAHVGFCFSNASTFVKALNAYAPGSALPCMVGPPPGTLIPGASLVPMIGSAPAASLYHLRVLGPTGGGSTSGVIAAMERAIELREKYDGKMPGGVNIQVANMSLGSSTLNPGRELIDEVVRRMYDAGIVVVIASGNNGPATLTTGSPAASADDLTVGAASTGPHERVLRDIQFGSGVGGLFRPSNTTQVAYFSSRGPNADGRREPDVVANGMGNFGQGYGANPFVVNWGAGTSYAAPSVAGVAAVLRHAYPLSTARQIRNAIRMAANASVIPGATDLDQGAGFVNAGAAAALLAAGKAPNTGGVLPNASSQVKVNVENLGGLNVRNGFVTESMSNLIPAERRDLVYRVNPNVRQVVIALSGFSAALPASQQNQAFGDDIQLAVHTAKTSSIGASGDYPVYEHLRNGAVVVNDPEPGLMRISVSGSWTNAGAVSVSVAAQSLVDPIPHFTTQDKIVTNQAIMVPFQVPAGVGKLDMRASWREGWENLPPSDIDVFLVPPLGPPVFNGATLNAPERVTINKPVAGNWLAVVYGYEVQAGTDKFELRIALDDQVVKK